MTISRNHLIQASGDACSVSKRENGGYYVGSINLKDTAELREFVAALGAVLQQIEAEQTKSE